MPAKKIKRVLKKDFSIVSIGFGSMAAALCECFRDSGAHVSIGARDPRSASALAAKRAGFPVAGIEKSLGGAEVVLLAIPDGQISHFFNAVSPEAFSGKCVVVCHGISYYFDQKSFPEGCDVVMISPNAIANKFRENFLGGRKNFAIGTVLNDNSGHSEKILKKLCGLLAIRGDRLISAPLREEVISDLFAEQTLLVGGIIAMMTTSFEVMVDKGISEKTAYVSTFHEIRYIVDTICDSGLRNFLSKISDTALYGSIMALWHSGVRSKFKSTFERIFAGIENGKFFKEIDASMKDAKKKAELDKFIEEIKSSGICRLYDKYGR